MLKRFEVNGFKNFADNIVINFDNVGDFDFSQECISDDLVKTAIIYGKNSVGKSNFGLAIFDIVSHLTSNNVTPKLYDYYLNFNTSQGYATFKYVFQFDEAEVTYTYRKDDKQHLLYESLFINQSKFFEYDFVTDRGDYVGIDNKWKNSLANLETNQRGNVSKVLNLRYLPFIEDELSEMDVIVEMVEFVSNMLWFRNLDENRFIGYKSDAKDYLDFIFEPDMLGEFQVFLNKAGVKDKLVVKENVDTSRELYIEGLRPLPFFKVASSGTRSLYNFFYWIKTSKDASIIFIDEFDSYYHFELAEVIVEMLRGMKNTQVILTSHNTNLLTNRIMRPDCFFVLTKSGITSFADATDFELKEGHNLEKLYMSGEFNG